MRILQPIAQKGYAFADRGDYLEFRGPSDPCNTQIFAVDDLEEFVRARAAVARATEGPSSCGKFSRLKREFARLYHPNVPGRGPLEQAVRAEVFKEFWGIIKAVEAE